MVFLDQIQSMFILKSQRLASISERANNLANYKFSECHKHSRTFIIPLVFLLVWSTCVIFISIDFGAELSILV